MSIFPFASRLFVNTAKVYESHVGFLVSMVFLYLLQLENLLLSWQEDMSDTKPRHWDRRSTERKRLRWVTTGI